MSDHVKAPGKLEDEQTVEVVEDIYLNGAEILSFRIKWTFKRLRVGFKVFEGEGAEDTDAGWVPVFERLVQSGGGGQTTRLTEEAVTYLEGHIKWDGCSDVKNDGGWYHACDSRGFKAHCILLRHLWKTAVMHHAAQGNVLDPW